MVFRKTTKALGRFGGANMVKGLKWAGKGIKHRYGGKKGLNQVIKDIAYLKKQVNAEKKRIEYTFSVDKLAQFTCNSAGTNLDTGYIMQDITPAPAQGTAVASRTGNSVKLTSISCKFELANMTNTTSPMKYKLWIIEIIGQPQTVNATLVNKFLNLNNFSGFTDYHSERDSDYFKMFKIHAYRSGRVQQDSYSGALQLKDFTIPIKFRKGLHLRWSEDTSTITKGQLMMLMVADSGNDGTAVASTGFGAYTTPPILTDLTGNYLFCNYKAYFYDN